MSTIFLQDLEYLNQFLTVTGLNGMPPWLTINKTKVQKYGSVAIISKYFTMKTCFTFAMFLSQHCYEPTN